MDTGQTKADSSIVDRAFARLFAKWPYETWWRFLNVGALGIGSAFLASVLFTYNWGDGPLFWRVFSPKDISIGPGNHHTLIMVAIAAAFYFVVKKGVVPLIAVMGVYFMVEAHEAEWYVTYLAWKFFWPDSGLFQWSWLSATVLMFPAIIFFIYVFGVPWKFLGFLGVFYAGWLAIDFPITQDFYEHTVYYASASVSALEIMSWVWVITGFLLFVYPVMKKRSEVFKVKWWVH